MCHDLILFQFEKLHGKRYCLKQQPPHHDDFVTAAFSVACWLSVSAALTAATSSLTTAAADLRAPTFAFPTLARALLVRFVGLAAFGSTTGAGSMSAVMPALDGPKLAWRMASFAFLSLNPANSFDDMPADELMTAVEE